jgi:hypothetical protein
MASIELTRREAEDGDLPNVCMRCGEPATVRKRRLFVSHPLWIYVLLPFWFVPYAIVAAILTQRVRCYSHFCPRHKNHWLTRALIIWGGFPVLLALYGAGFFIAAWIEESGNISNDTLGAMAAVWNLGLLLLWLTSIPFCQLTAIHPANVTERRLTLQRVAPAFVEAVRNYREKPTSRAEREEYWNDFQARISEPRQEVHDPANRPATHSNQDAIVEGE